MIRSVTLSICLAALLIFTSTPFAATAEVVMKNGTIINGTILREDGSGMTLISDEKEINIPRSMIASIKTTPESKPADAARAPVSTPSPSSSTASAAAPAPVAVPPSPSASAAPLSTEVPPSTSPVPSTPDRPTPEPPAPMQVRVGIDIDFHLTSIIDENFLADTANSELTSTLMLKPHVGMMLTPLFELRPAVRYTLNKYTYRYTPVDSLTTGTTVIAQQRVYSQSGLGIEFGFIFHPVNNGVFRFTIGPALGADYLFKPDTVLRFFNAPDIVNTPDSYRRICAALSVPFSLDFVPAKHLGIRISNDLLRVQTEVYSSQKGGAYEGQRFKTTADLNLPQLLTELKIGLFWLF